MPPTIIFREVSITAVLICFLVKQISGALDGLALNNPEIMNNGLTPNSGPFLRAVNPGPAKAYNFLPRWSRVYTGLLRPAASLIPMQVSPNTNSAKPKFDSSIPVENSGFVPPPVPDVQIEPGPPGKEGMATDALDDLIFHEDFIKLIKMAVQQKLMKRRRVPRAQPGFEQAHEINSGGRRVKKDSAYLPQPGLGYGQQQGGLPFHPPQIQLQGPSNAFQGPVQTPNYNWAPNPYPNAQPVPLNPRPQFPLPRQAQPQYGPAISPYYDPNPDATIDTKSGPFHFEMPIVSDFSAPRPSLQEMMDIAVQYKYPLNFEGIVPEVVNPVPQGSEPQRQFPPVVGRVERDQHDGPQAKEPFEVYDNLGTNDVSVQKESVPQEGVEEAQMFGEILSGSLNNDNRNIEKILYNVEEPKPPLSLESQPNSTALIRTKRADPGAPSIEESNAEAELQRPKRGLFTWLKNLFQKKEPETTPNPIISEPFPENYHPNTPMLAHTYSSPSHSEEERPYVVQYPESHEATSRPKELDSRYSFYARFGEPPEYSPAQTFEEIAHAGPPGAAYLGNTNLNTEVASEHHSLPHDAVVEYRAGNSSEHGHDKIPEFLGEIPQDPSIFPPVAQGSPANTRPDSLLPSTLRTSSYSERTAHRYNYESSSSNHEVFGTTFGNEPRTRGKRSILEPTPNPKNSRPIPKLSKQEMRLLHDQFLSILAAKCLVNSLQIARIDRTVQEIIDESSLQEIHFTVTQDASVARLSEQLAACSSRSTNSPAIRNYGNVLLQSSYPDSLRFQSEFQNDIIGEVEQGEPVFRRKRNKRNLQPPAGGGPYASRARIPLPIPLAYLLHVEFLIVQVVGEQCGAEIDGALLHSAYKIISSTIEETCREKCGPEVPAGPQQPYPSVNLDNDLFYCVRSRGRQDKPNLPQGVNQSPNFRSTRPRRQHLSKKIGH